MDLVWCTQCLSSIVSWFDVCSTLRLFFNAYLSVIFLRHILASDFLIAVVLPAEVVQWLKLVWSKWPIWVGVSPPFTWRRKKNHLPKRRYFIYFYILSGRWTKSRRQLALSCKMFIFVIHSYYMFRPHILAIFRELHVWWTCTAYMATCRRWLADCIHKKHNKNTSIAVSI